MESALLSLGASPMSIMPSSKCVTAHSAPLIAQLHCGGLIAARTSQLGCLQLSRCGELSSCGRVSVVWGLGLHRSRLQFAARSASGGGGFGGVDGGSGGGGGGGGGDGAAGGDEARPATVAPGAGDDAVLSSDVIVLGVGGMTCGGCAESVRKILESQPQVSSASVNLKTETAIVWPVSEVKATPNWRKDIGEALAKHLTSCGFKSDLKDQGAEGNIQS